MSIEKHTTKAFVLTSYEKGEHDMLYKLFTEEFGLLFGLAKSVRKLESKMRAHLRIGHFVQVTLVQGKEVWRIVGVEEAPLDGSLRNTACALLDRFVKGTTPQRRLFEHVVSLLRYEEKETTKESGTLLLYYLMLVDLGYADATVGGAETSTTFFKWGIVDHLTHLTLNQQRVRTHVHGVLKEMQL